MLIKAALKSVCNSNKLENSNFPQAAIKEKLQSYQTIAGLFGDSPRQAALSF